MTRLTDLKVRQIKPEPKAKKHTDGGGLFLLVAPTGGKLWRLAYRYDGKQKLMALGAYPAVGLKAARERRDAARELLANGVDPGENRKAVKAAKTEQASNSFEVVAREWIARGKPAWAPSHTVKIERRFEMYVFPWIGGKPIPDVSGYRRARRGNSAPVGAGAAGVYRWCLPCSGCRWAG